MFGLTDWSRNGSLAEYTAVEARNLAPLAADIDHTVAAALPISGLTAWQGLFVHAGLTTGQTVVVHGAAGGVGSIALQLAREVGAQVIGTGRTDDRDVVLGLGAQAFLDLDADPLEGVGEVDAVFDVIGGDVLERSTALVRPGGTLVTIAMPPTVQPKEGRAVFFVVEPDRARLADLAQRLRDGRLKPIVGAVRPLTETADAFARHRRTPGKTIIQIARDQGGETSVIGARIANGVLATAVAAVVVGCAPAAEPQADTASFWHTRPRPWRPSSNRCSRTSRAKPSPRRS